MLLSTSAFKFNLRRYIVGSKNWIGAIELSYVLDETLGISCKIMVGRVSQSAGIRKTGKRFCYEIHMECFPADYARHVIMHLTSYNPPL
jgi:hypothetical protein